jgi:hypothetical protein
LSVDPIAKQYPNLTSYQFASNTPVMAVDLDGMEAWAVNSRTGETVTGPIDITHYKKNDAWTTGTTQMTVNQF